jgi:hypothetical protein
MAEHQQSTKSNKRRFFSTRARVSRQREWQLRKVAEGRCSLCGKLRQSRPSVCDACHLKNKSKYTSRSKRDQALSFADYWAERAENARFMAALRGLSEDETPTPFVRCFVDEIDAMVETIRLCFGKSKTRLAAPVPCGITSTLASLQTETPTDGAAHIKT